MISGKGSWGFLGPLFFLLFFFCPAGLRLRELAHGFFDEEEEIQIPNHFHPGGADCGPLRERGPLLQSPAAGWRGFCQFVVQVGIEAFVFAGEGVCVGGGVLVSEILISGSLRCEGRARGFRALYVSLGRFALGRAK